MHDGNLLGERFAGPIRDVEFVCRNVLERSSLLAPPVEEGRRGTAGAARKEGALEHHDAVGIRVGERFEQDSVDHREHGAVGGDAERDSSDGREGEAGAAPEEAGGVAEVVGERAGMYGRRYHEERKVKGQRAKVKSELVPARLDGATTFLGRAAVVRLLGFRGARAQMERFQQALRFPQHQFREIQ